MGGFLLGKGLIGVADVHGGRFGWMAFTHTGIEFVAAANPVDCCSCDLYNEPKLIMVVEMWRITQVANRCIRYWRFRVFFSVHRDGLCYALRCIRYYGVVM